MKKKYVTMPGKKKELHAVSQSQQRLFGMVTAYLEGKLDLDRLPSSLAKRIKDIADGHRRKKGDRRKKTKGISKRAAKEIASTKRKGLPNRMAAESVVVDYDKFCSTYKLNESKNREIDRNAVEYYITPGEGGKMFTLRKKVWEWDGAYGRWYQRSIYAGTLSTDLEKAKEKAKKLIGYVPEVVGGDVSPIIRRAPKPYKRKAPITDDDVKKITIPYSKKYDGVPIGDIPSDYLRWWVERRLNGKYIKKNNRIARAIDYLFRQRGDYDPDILQKGDNISIDDLVSYIQYGFLSKDYDKVAHEATCNVMERFDSIVEGDANLKDPVLTVGKYKGKRISEIPPDYLRWLYPKLKSKLPYSCSNQPERPDCVAVVLNVCKYGHFVPSGYITNLVLYKAVKERLAHEQEEQTSDYIGNIGDKITANVTVISKKEITTMYGPTTLIKMKDDHGNILATMGRNKTIGKLEEGDEVTVAGTVTKHNEYRGTKETIISRISIV